MNITSLLERKLRKCEAICLKLKTNAKLSEENPHQIEYEENMEILSEKNDQWSKQEEMLIRLEKDVSNSQVELTTGNHIDEKSISQLEDQNIKKQKLFGGTTKYMLASQRQHIRNVQKQPIVYGSDGKWKGTWLLPTSPSRSYS
jgi:hypothetical protein